MKRQKEKTIVIPDEQASETSPKLITPSDKKKPEKKRGRRSSTEIETIHFKLQKLAAEAQDKKEKPKNPKQRKKSRPISQKERPVVQKNTLTLEVQEEQNNPVLQKKDHKEPAEQLPSIQSLFGSILEKPPVVLPSINELLSSDGKLSESRSFSSGIWSQPRSASPAYFAAPIRSTRQAVYTEYCHQAKELINSILQKIYESTSDFNHFIDDIANKSVLTSIMNLIVLDETANTITLVPGLFDESKTVYIKECLVLETILFFLNGQNGNIFSNPQDLQRVLNVLQAALEYFSALNPQQSQTPHIPSYSN